MTAATKSMITVFCLVVVIQGRGSSGSKEINRTGGRNTCSCMYPGKRKFWVQPNKPDWWPEELQFQSLNVCDDCSHKINEHMGVKNWASPVILSGISFLHYTGSLPLDQRTESLEVIGNCKLTMHKYKF